ncbi:DEAD/DEAH box helicase [Sphingomonas sp.]|uniref:DEAD/DEAH box helicase n=1 Tax=Sphingomonas sp. TaxID=28214 RepID=UPI003D6D4DBE
MISDMAFQGRWRDYQDQVLADLDTHLADDRLHVVAAPGSGKTVLGLEVMRRIGRPALILAPTIAVRNQWVDRLCGMFLPAPHTQPDWVSTSLAAPAPVTVLTYQALYAAMGETGDRIEPDIIDPEIIADDTVEEQADATPVRIETLLAHFRALGPTTIILDEAHHLRREWWRALNTLHAALPEARLVSLTATPPYDVEYTEWVRYETLCGPIDAEIPVPELVRNGDLCPHQDYVHVSQPTGSEDALLAARRDGLYAFVTALQADTAFRALILTHPYLTNTAAHEEEILAAPEFFSSMLIFAFSTDTPPPRDALHLLGIGRADMPPMSLGWLEILLTGLLFATADQIEDKVRLTAIKADLRQLGAIEARRVRLVDQSELHSTVAGSIAKLGKALYLLTRNGTLEGSMTQVGQVVVDSLAHAGLLSSDPDAIRVEARKSALGKSLVHIEGATRIEERLILDSIEEVLGPVRNPRYLLMRSSPLGRWLRIDYHAVPTAIGQHKDHAEFFARRWARHVGAGKLVYLRNAKGRRILLRARARSMAAGFQRAVDRLSVWQ